MKLTFELMNDKFADAKIIRASRARYWFGKQCDDHMVMMILAEADKKNYEETLLVMLKEGSEWEFARGETRVVTEDDQRSQWEILMSKFPAFPGPRELSQEGVDAFAEWIRSGNATARISIGGVSTDANGVEHHKCKIVKQTNRLPAMPKPDRAMPKPEQVNTQQNSVKVFTADDAWNAYEGGHRILDDPQGKMYWDAVAEIVGKPSGNYKSFTSEDWAKCVKAFS